MRIDKYLNAVNITKRRSVAQDMITSGVVSINDKVVKASKNVEIGNVISIAYLKGAKQYEVLDIPTTKSTPKSEQDRYIKECS
jgi:ribosomal 50S subunit-recycling heat shock protein